MCPTFLVMRPTHCVCGCKDPPRQLSSLFPLPPAGLDPLHFLVKPRIIYITWVRLNKWRYNHKRQKWSPMPKWTYCKPHWHSLAVGRAQLLSDEKRREKKSDTSGLCPSVFLNKQTKIQKSFLFGINIFLPGTLAAGISGGLWVGGDTDSLFTCQVSPVTVLQLSPTEAQGENDLVFLPCTLYPPTPC